MHNRLSPVLFAVLVAAAFLLVAPAQATAGLFEEITHENGVGWRVNLSPDPEEMGRSLKDVLVRKPRKAKLIDERYDPSLMIRTLFVATLEDQAVQIDPTTREPVLDSEGNPRMVSSKSQDPSLFGHRDGFVLENVEIGLGGRFNDAGFYYKASFELVPKEKDGNRSSDYLKDAYIGWDYYSVFDLRVGRMKVPFSQANLTSTGKRYFVYAPTFDVMIPKRQVGVQMAFSDPWEVFTLTGGIYNSVKLAIEQMQSLDQLLYVSRAVFDVDNLLRAINVNPLNLDLRIGANVAWVKENFDPDTEHRWLGVDLHMHLYVFTLEAELMFLDFYEDNQPDRGWGWNVDFIVHAWPGVIDAGFRVEMMDGNKSPEWYDPTFPIDALTRSKKLWYTVGLTFHPWKYARLDFNYVIRQEKEDYEFRNDVIMGMFQLYF